MISSVELKFVPITKWVALAGRWSFTTDAARFEAPSTPPPDGYGLAISNERFLDGRARATLRFEGNSDEPPSGSAGIVLGYHSESGSYVVAGLGANNYAYSLWECVPGFGWINQKHQGVIQNLRCDQEYALDVIQRGQRISLSVNDVEILEHVLPSPLRGNQLGLYVMSNSPVTFQKVEAQSRKPMAFVAMQFGEPYDTLYRQVIRKKAEQMGFDVLRIDEVNRPGIIFQDIQQKIEGAKVVIAEITAPNQNVYYEIGYAHALKKPTILLAQRDRELPFDIRSYRVIFYDDSIGGKPLVEKTLREHLASILQQV